MHIIILPKIEPNMEQASVAAWLKLEGEEIKKGEPLFEIETAKALIEIEAEYSGFLRKILIQSGKTVPILTPLALIGEAQEPLPDLSKIQIQPLSKKNLEINFLQNKTAETPTSSVEIERIKSSPAAKRLAKEKNVDLKRINGSGPEGRIIEEDIKKFLEKNIKLSTQTNSYQPKRILIIGAGNGGEVVADILSSDTANEIIGFLDDNQLLWGKYIWNKPIFGGIKILEKIFKEKNCTHLCLSITSNMKIRKKIYNLLKTEGYLFLNAIHPTAYLNQTSKIGEGNIIGAFVHLGYGTEVGDNNLISAHCDIEHHNHIGSHILFGPGVMTSGDVKIGDLCSLGAGVNIEPHVIIGSDTAIASGSTIIFSIPSNTIIKSEFKKNR